MTKDNPLTTRSVPELNQLERIVGQFMSYWGFKSIHGRIWVHLYLSIKPLDSAEMMSRLKVSKALMSTALRELMEYQVIRPVETGRHGTVFYEANPNLQKVIMGVLRSRERVMLDMAMSASTRLANIHQKEMDAIGLSFERVQDVKNLTESAQMLLGLFLELKKPEDNFTFQNLFQQTEA